MVIDVENHQDFELAKEYIGKTLITDKGVYDHKLIVKPIKIILTSLGYIWLVCTTMDPNEVIKIETFPLNFITQLKQITGRFTGLG
jgi:hypothetical protein